MLGVDLTVPIVILGVAVAIVLALRAAVAWAELRTEERTTRLLRELGLETEHEVKREPPDTEGPGDTPGTQA